MKKINIVFLLIISFALHAQVKIGSPVNEIIPNAMFQINGDNILPGQPSTYKANSFIFYLGNVGIGTQRPSSQLDIVTDRQDNTSMGIINTSTGGRKWFLNSVGTNASNPTTTGAFLIWDGTAGTGPFMINKFGNVGINNLNPSATLDVTGSIKANSIEGPSDIRFKKNIQPLKNSLAKVLALNGYTYEWKKEDFPQKKFKSGRDIGLIAQEVEKVVPEVVFTADDEMKSKSIDYSKLVPLLVESIKELKAEVEQLKAQLKSQDGEQASIQNNKQ